MRPVALALLACTLSSAAVHTGSLPLNFDQLSSSEGATFSAATPNYSLQLSAGGVTLRNNRDREFRLEFAGAQPAQGRGISGAGVSNYFLGADPAQWCTGVAHYSRVQFLSVYPGVDIEYYGNEGSLEFDLIVAPGADPSGITLNFSRGCKTKVHAGDLAIQCDSSQLLLRKPVVYQMIGGSRRPIDARFLLGRQGSARISVARWDRRLPLVIDPTVVYATYVGGTISDGAAGIAVDAQGNAYVVGYTYSKDVPVTSGAFKPAASIGIYAAFITKLDPTGSKSLYSTLFGGLDNTTSQATGVPSRIMRPGSRWIQPATPTLRVSRKAPTSLPSTPIRARQKVASMTPSSLRSTPLAPRWCMPLI